MRAWAVVVIALSVAPATTGCREKREVRSDAGADAAAVRTAPGAGLDGGSVTAAGDAGAVTPTGAAGGDAGAPDDALPPPNAADLTLRGKHLLEAITADNAELANDFLFPRDAFVAARDTADPAKLWEKQIQPAFQRDVHTLHKRIKASDAQFVSLEVGQAIVRIVPKKKDFKKALWRVKHSKLAFTVDGKPQRIEIGEMVSWRGAWYVTKLK
ncbi:MAG: hypothetical protein U0235_31815 [Polyangiaceae bacterium]